MRAAIAMLVLGAGCDALWGIEHVEGGATPDGSDPDFDHNMVHGRYVQRWVENAPDSATPVPKELSFTAAQLTAEVTLDDGSHRAVTITDDGFSFTTPAPGDRYTIRFRTPVGSRTWLMRSSAPQLVERYRFRPDRPQAPAGTRLTLNVAQRTQMPTEELVTTGSWSRTNVDATAVTVDASATDIFGTQIGMLAPHDAAYYTRTEAVADYFHMVATAKIPDVAMQPAIDNIYPASGMIAPVILPLTGCAKVQAHGDDEAQRITRAYPDVAGTFAVWSVDLDPSLELGLTVSLPVAKGGADGVVRDVAYGNPYGLHQVDVLQRVIAQTSHDAAIETLSITPAKSDCSVVIELGAGAVEIPTAIQLGGVPLAATDQDVTLPLTGDVEVTWQPSADGAASYYIVALEEVLGPSELRTIEQVVTTERFARFPVGAFAPGASYDVRITAVVGFSHASAGDFLSVAAPLGQGTVKTPAFRPR